MNNVEIITYKEYQINDKPMQDLHSILRQGACTCTTITLHFARWSARYIHNGMHTTPNHFTSIIKSICLSMYYFTLISTLKRVAYENRNCIEHYLLASPMFDEFPNWYPRYPWSLIHNHHIERCTPTQVNAAITYSDRGFSPWLRQGLYIEQAVSFRVVAFNPG